MPPTAVHPCPRLGSTPQSESGSTPLFAVDYFVLGGVYFPCQRNLALALSDAQYERVRGIFVHNVASQRAQRVVAKYLAQGQHTSEADAGPTIDPLQWEQYQRQVIYTFQYEHVRHDALQEGDIDAWNALARQLTLAAQRMLEHSGTCRQYAREQAADLSQQACAHICAATYPWDVSFDLWAHTILHNVFLQRYTRSHDLLDRVCQAGEPLELDELYGGVSAAHGLCGESDSGQELLSADELIAAIEQMRSQQQRAVIIYTYYEELSDEEIAAAIGKSRSVVQTLRHRALRRLRTLLNPE